MGVSILVGHSYWLVQRTFGGGKRTFILIGAEDLWGREENIHTDWCRGLVREEDTHTDWYRGMKGEDIHTDWCRTFWGRRPREGAHAYWIVEDLPVGGGRHSYWLVQRTWGGRPFILTGAEDLGEERTSKLIGEVNLGKGKEHIHTDWCRWLRKGGE